jgi:hypothetical protein
MTTVHSSVRSLPVPLTSWTRSTRFIAVGVRDRSHDAAALRWAADDAVAGLDSLHVVHAYVPLRLDGCAWDPVSRARDARYLAARRIAAQAVQHITTSHRGLRVSDSAIAGLPEDVLYELSSIVDVLVIGVIGVIGDDADQPAHRELVERVQDAARCPVVTVPSDALPGRDRPVTVVADEAGLPEAALTFAAEFAQRHDVALQVSRSWSSLHEGPPSSISWLAHQQEELDGQLADLRDQFPHLPIASRIELCDDWLPAIAAGSRLLVVDQESVQLVRTRGWLRCPLAVVPARDPE